MHRIQFKSEHGGIEATVVCHNPTVSREVFERATNSLLEHLATHMMTATFPEVFKKISEMKANFLREVLNYTVAVAAEQGEEIPKAVREYMAKGMMKEWAIHTDEENGSSPPSEHSVP